MSKLFTLPVVAILWTAVSFAQIPISPSTAPQPQLVPCSPSPNSLIGETWSFFTFGPVIEQVGQFTIQAGSRGGPGLSITGNQTTDVFNGFPFASTLLERMMPFGGSIDTLCLAGTNTLAGGTLQIADGLAGQILTWSFPISFSGGTFNVTSVSTMNLRQYGAVDPVRPANSTVAGSRFPATLGTAVLIMGQVPCPANPNLALDISVAPHGFTVAATPDMFGLPPGTLTFTAGSGPVGTVTGTIFGNTASNPQPVETGTYQVLPGCTGFVFSLPEFVFGFMFPTNFDGVFAAGDFSKAFFVDEQALAASFTMTRNP